MYKPILVLVLATGFNTSVFAMESANASFPNTPHGARSPDKRFAILNEDIEGQEFPHSLRLKDEKSGQNRKILDYRRHVDVSWSPGSQAFYVNDYSSSDASNCLIVIAESGEEINLSELIKAKEGENSTLWSSHHKFVTCTSWVNGKVVVSFAGYGDFKPKGFELHYILELKNKKIRR